MKIFRIAVLACIFAVAIAFRQAGKSAIFAAVRPSTGAAVSTMGGDHGGKVYEQDCAICHGQKLEGYPPAFPALTGVGHSMNPEQVSQIVRNGRGRMPGFTTSKLGGDDLSALLAYLEGNPVFTSTGLAVAPAPAKTGLPSGLEAGNSIYQQNCAFCHGRDADGGETGPDLTSSKLVASDVHGDKISNVVRNGRPENKMPKFNFSDSEMSELVRFIHAEAILADSRPGGRRGVDVADLQTGNAAAGKQYFDGAGGCSSCHSPTGDLAGIASRYEGLKLEEQMLYPKDAKDTLTVTLPDGQTITGRLEYQDEFVIGMRDAGGTYRSWPTGSVKYKIDSPVSAHVDLFAKYSDEDVHNLMAYIQTLK